MHEHKECPTSYCRRESNKCHGSRDLACSCRSTCKWASPTIRLSSSMKLRRSMMPPVGATTVDSGDGTFLWLEWPSMLSDDCSHSIIRLRASFGRTVGSSRFPALSRECSIRTFSRIEETCGKLVRSQLFKGASFPRCHQVPKSLSILACLRIPQFIGKMR